MLKKEQLNIECINLFKECMYLLSSEYQSQYCSESARLMSMHALSSEIRSNLLSIHSKFILSYDKSFEYHVYVYFILSKRVMDITYYYYYYSEEIKQYILLQQLEISSGIYSDSLHSAKQILNELKYFRLILINDIFRKKKSAIEKGQLFYYQMGKELIL